MMALAVPPDLGSRPLQKTPANTPIQRDILVLFDTDGQILWMNRGAREALGPIANVVEALESGRRLPADARRATAAPESPTGSPSRSSHLGRSSWAD